MLACMGCKLAWSHNAHEEEQVRKCQDLLNYGEIEDPAKTTHAKMAFAKRDLGAKRAHANSWSVMMMERACAWAQEMCMRACKHAAQRTLSACVDNRRDWTCSWPVHAGIEPAPPGS